MTTSPTRNKPLTVFIPIEGEASTTSEPFLSLRDKVKSIREGSSPRNNINNAATATGRTSAVNFLETSSMMKTSLSSHTPLHTPLSPNKKRKSVYAHLHDQQGFSAMTTNAGGSILRIRSTSNTNLDELIDSQANNSNNNTDDGDDRCGFSTHSHNVDVERRATTSSLTPQNKIYFEPPPSELLSLSRMRQNSSKSPAVNDISNAKGGKSPSFLSLDPKLSKVMTSEAAKRQQQQKGAKSETPPNLLNEMFQKLDDDDENVTSSPLIPRSASKSEFAVVEENSDEALALSSSTSQKTKQQRLQNPFVRSRYSQQEQEEQFVSAVTPPPVNHSITNVIIKEENPEIEQVESDFESELGAEIEDENKKKGERHPTFTDQQGQQQQQHARRVYQPRRRPSVDALRAIMAGSVPAYQVAEAAMEKHTAEEERKKRQFSGYHTANQHHHHQPHHQLQQQQQDSQGSGALARAQSLSPNFGSFVVRKPHPPPSSSGNLASITSGSTATLSRAGSLLPHQLQQQQQQQQQQNAGGGVYHQQQQLQQQPSYLGSGTNLVGSPLGISASASSANLIHQLNNLTTGGGGGGSGSSGNVTSSYVTSVRSTRELESIEQLIRNQHESALIMSLNAKHEFVRDFFRRKIGWSSASASIQRAETMLRSQIVSVEENFWPRIKKMSSCIPITITSLSSSTEEEKQEVFTINQLVTLEQETRTTNFNLYYSETFAPRLAVEVAETYHRAEINTASFIMWKRFKVEFDALFRRHQLVAKTWSGLALNFFKEQMEMHQRQKHRTFSLMIQLFHFECSELIARDKMLAFERNQRFETIIQPEEEISKLISEKRKLFRSLMGRAPMPWSVFCERWDITHACEIPERSVIEREQQNEMFDIATFAHEELRRGQLEHDESRSLVQHVNQLLNEVKEVANQMSVIVLSSSAVAEETNFHSNGENYNNKERNNNNEEKKIVDDINSDEDDDEAQHNSKDRREHRVFYEYLEKCLAYFPQIVRIEQTIEEKNQLLEQNLICLYKFPHKNNNKSTTDLDIEEDFGDDDVEARKAVQQLNRSFEVLYKELFEFEVRRRNEVEFLYQMQANGFAWFLHGMRQYLRRGFFALPSTAPYLAISESSPPPASIHDSFLTNPLRQNSLQQHLLFTPKTDSSNSNVNQQQQQQQQHLLHSPAVSNKSSVGSPILLLAAERSASSPFTTKQQKNSSSPSSPQQQQQPQDASPIIRLTSSSASNNKSYEGINPFKSSVNNNDINTVNNGEEMQSNKPEQQLSPLQLHQPHQSSSPFSPHNANRRRSSVNFTIPPEIAQKLKEKEEQQLQQQQQQQPLPELSNKTSSGLNLHPDVLAQQQQQQGNNNNSLGQNNSLNTSQQQVRRSSYQHQSQRRLSQLPMQIPDVSPEAFRAAQIAKDTEKKFGSYSNKRFDSSKSDNIIGNNNNLNTSNNGSNYNSNINQRRSSSAVNNNTFTAYPFLESTEASTVFAPFGGGLIDDGGNNDEEQNENSSRTGTTTCYDQPLVGELMLQLWRQVEYQRKAITYFEQREFSEMMDFSFITSILQEEKEREIEKEEQEKQKQAQLDALKLKEKEAEQHQQQHQEDETTKNNNTNKFFSTSSRRSVLSVQSSISPAGSSILLSPTASQTRKNSSSAQQQQQFTPKRFQENISVGRGMLMMPLKEKMTSLLQMYRERTVQIALWQIEGEYLRQADQIIIEERKMRRGLLGWSCRCDDYPGPFAIVKAKPTAVIVVAATKSKTNSYRSDDDQSEISSSGTSSEQQVEVEETTTTENIGGVLVTKKKNPSGEQEEFTEDFVVAVMASMNSHELSASWSSMMMSFL